MAQPEQGASRGPPRTKSAAPVAAPERLLRVRLHRPWLSALRLCPCHHRAPWTVLTKSFPLSPTRNTTRRWSRCLDSYAKRGNARTTSCEMKDVPLPPVSNTRRTAGWRGTRKQRPTPLPVFGRRSRGTFTTDGTTTTGNTPMQTRVRLTMTCSAGNALRCGLQSASGQTRSGLHGRHMCPLLARPYRPSSILHRRAAPPARTQLLPSGQLSDSPPRPPASTPLPLLSCLPTPTRRPAPARWRPQPRARRRRSPPLRCRKARSTARSVRATCGHSCRRSLLHRSLLRRSHPPRPKSRHRSARRCDLSCHLTASSPKRRTTSSRSFRTWRKATLPKPDDCSVSPATHALRWHTRR